jgi:hypothetical protein
MFSEELRIHFTDANVLVYVETDDFNGDGLPDIAVGNDAGCVEVLLGFSSSEVLQDEGKGSYERREGSTRR